MSNNEKFTIEGKAFWAHVRKPGDKSPDKYTLDLSIDSETAKLLASKGVKTKDKRVGRGTEETDPNDPRGEFVTLKALAKGEKDGKVVHFAPPLVIDGKMNTVPADILIGNGSIVKVETNVFDYRKIKGKGLGLGTIQIKALIPYSSSTAKLTNFSEEDGYVIDTSSSESKESLVEDLPVGDESPFDD